MVSRIRYFFSDGADPVCGSRRNIFSMRSVMRNPPTTFVVAHTTAMKPSAVATPPRCAPAATIEPTSEMPEMALVADISGVCSSGGTRVITMKPTKPARTKTYSSRISIASPGRRNDDLAVAHDGHRRSDLVVPIEMQRALVREVRHEGENVLAEHLAGVVGDGGGQVHRPQDGH